MPAKLYKSFPALAAVALLSGCALFEADLELPIRPDAAVDSGMPAPDADMTDAAADTDARSDDGGVGEDAGVEDAGPDMGMVPGIGCSPRVLIDSDADANANLQVEALSGGELVVGWSGAGSTIIFNHISQPGAISTITDSTFKVPQNFSILASLNSNTWFFATSDGNFVQCDGSVCNVLGSFSAQRAQAVTGGWNGGDELPYIQYLAADQITTGPWTDRLVPVMRTQIGEVTSPSWIGLSLLNIPPSPELTTSTFGAYVTTSGDVRSYQRVASGEPIDQPNSGCSAFNVDGKIETITGEMTAVGAITEQDDSFIATADCEGVGTTKITEGIPTLRDWSTIATNRRHTFYVDDVGLHLETLGVGGDLYIREGDYTRVDAALLGPDSFAVVTVNADQQVELHRFDIEGNCQ